MTVTNALANIVCGLAAVAGLAAGFSLSPGGTVSAQRPDARDTRLPLPPEWKTSYPAPSLPPGNRTLWPNQPTAATYWAVEDVRKAHQLLMDVEKTGRTVDPNSTLHDFPYWTRTHSMFVARVSPKASGATAQQHLGYAQFIVVMGGAGTLVAGGELRKATVLAEGNRQIAGELRGTGITGGETFHLKAGDVVSIPANTPAQFMAGSPDGLTYMVAKVNAMLYPWELIR